MGDNTLHDDVAATTALAAAVPSAVAVAEAAMYVVPINPARILNTSCMNEEISLLASGQAYSREINPNAATPQASPAVGITQANAAPVLAVALGKWKFPRNKIKNRKTGDFIKAI